MVAPKILTVQALENKKLRVKFANGIEKVYDCAPLLNIDLFRLLKNDAFFKSVKVDAGGYGVSWNDDADLSEYELWTKGVEVVMAV
jgi:Protein of unknown function (DUF2442)